jgi:hypothetical protein
MERASLESLCELIDTKVEHRDQEAGWRAAFVFEVGQIGTGLLCVPLGRESCIPCSTLPSDDLQVMEDVIGSPMAPPAYGHVGTYTCGEGWSAWSPA